MVIGLVRAGSTCTDGLEGSPGRSDSHFRGGCGQRAARRALRSVRGRAGSYARARGRAREKYRRGCARQTTFSKRGVGFGASLAKTSQYVEDNSERSTLRALRPVFTTDESRPPSTRGKTFFTIGFVGVCVEYRLFPRRSLFVFIQLFCSLGRGGGETSG